jgi:hypothetical protein
LLRDVRVQRWPWLDHRGRHRRVGQPPALCQSADVVTVAPEFTFNQWREQVRYAVLEDETARHPVARSVKPTIAELFSRWLDALEEAYRLARAERLREIRGDRRVRTFDEQGVHPFSRAWGVVQACEDLLPGLSALRRPEGGVALEAWMVRRLAAREAVERACVGAATEGLEWFA